MTTTTDLKQDENPDKPELRIIEICEGRGQLYPGWYYRVKASNGEIVYSGETYPEKRQAITAARHEHEGRAKFSYLLKYPDANGVEVKETL